MNEGYIYCFSNPTMNGIVKIGRTDRDPKIRVQELSTTGVPLPFKIEVAIKVSNYKEKEKILHTLMSQYTERINPNREFFRISVEEVKVFFSLMDGEYWYEKKNEELDDEQEFIETNENIAIEKCRDMTKCFTDGQCIRHVIGINKIWIGIYNSLQNGIIYNKKTYSSLSSFAKAHNKFELPHRITNTANGWTECECQINEKWISTNSF